MELLDVKDIITIYFPMHTSKIKPRKDIPNKRPCSDFTAAHVRHCNLKSVCPGARACTYHLCTELQISISPSSRPIATLLENGSTAILLIGVGFQSPNRRRWAVNSIMMLHKIANSLQWWWVWLWKLDGVCLISDEWCRLSKPFRFNGWTSKRKKKKESVILL